MCILTRAPCCMSRSCGWYIESVRLNIAACRVLGSDQDNFMLVLYTQIDSRAIVKAIEIFKYRPGWLRDKRYLTLSDFMRRLIIGGLLDTMISAPSICDPSVLYRYGTPDVYTTPVTMRTICSMKRIMGRSYPTTGGMFAIRSAEISQRPILYESYP